MTEAQVEFKRRLRDQAEKLFAIARELEGMSSEATAQWSEAELDSECETFWSNMKNNLEDLVSNLDETYQRIDELAYGGDFLYNQSEEMSDEEFEEFERMLNEIDKEKPEID